MPPGQELAQPDPLEAGRSGAKEIAQATDHVGRALGFRLHAIDHIAQPLAGFTGSEQMLTRLGVHQQRGQWLMQFVRQGSGHLAGSGEAQRLLQLGTQPLLLVDHDADEESRQARTITSTSSSSRVRAERPSRRAAAMTPSWVSPMVSTAPARPCLAAAQAIGRKSTEKYLNSVISPATKVSARTPPVAHQAQRFPAKQQPAQAGASRAHRAASQQWHETRTPTTSPSQ
jgi:hypothetical protein